MFHFVFGLRPQTEPFHLVHYICLASCLAVNRPDQIYFHYEHLPYGEWWDRIKDRLLLNKIEPDAFINGFSYADSNIARYRYAHLSDITRLQILLQYGGVYADMDTIFVRRLAPSLFEQSCVMGAERVDWDTPAARQAGGSLCNAFIMADPDSAFIRTWLDRIYDQFDGSWSAHSTFLPYALSRQLPHTVHVEPESSFFKLDWSKDGIRRLFLFREAELEDAYSLHLWSHLWWDKSRVSHSFFHAGRLTPAYVAHAGTTYSRLAKPFLPDDALASEAVYKKETFLNQLENIGIWLRSQWIRFRRR